jgi:hypothetical protein
MGEQAMLKRLALTGALLAIAATAAFAAPMSGKVVAVKKLEVRVVVTGKLADWVKKGAGVSFLGTRGKIAGVAADTVIISSPNAAKTKAGAAVTFDKPRATAGGC